jgi:hypothetical protein
VFVHSSFFASVSSVIGFASAAGVGGGSRADVGVDSVAELSDSFDNETESDRTGGVRIFLKNQHENYQRDQSFGAPIHRPMPIETNKRSHRSRIIQKLYRSRREKDLSGCCSHDVAQLRIEKR